MLHLKNLAFVLVHIRATVTFVDPVACLDVLLGHTLQRLANAREVVLADLEVVNRHLRHSEVFLVDLQLELDEVYVLDFGEMPPEDVFVFLCQWVDMFAVSGVTDGFLRVKTVSNQVFIQDRFHFSRWTCLDWRFLLLLDLLLRTHVILKPKPFDFLLLIFCSLMNYLKSF